MVCALDDEDLFWLHLGKGKSMTQEALKLALDALEYWDVHEKLHQPTEEAITAIKEALEQLEELNFCPRCGKRTKDIHTCTPPMENT